MGIFMYGKDGLKLAATKAVDELTVCMIYFPAPIKHR